MKEFYQNKLIVVTGASTGIGKEITRQLVGFGARVAMIARRQELMEEFIKESSFDEQQCRSYKGDVSDFSDMEKAFAEISKWGKVDGVIANAGIGVAGSIRKLNAEKLGQMLDVNIKGVMYSLKAALPYYVGEGSFFAAISSLASYRSFPGSHCYSASKIAVNYINESARLELEPRGIYVSTICPGFIRTPMTASQKEKDMPFLMDVDKASEKILKAIKARKRKYSFPWQLNLILKGLSLVPEDLYYYLGKSKPRS